MIENKLDYVFACDSDLMIYANLYEDISLYKNYLACFCSTHYQENFRWSASGHISFWTLEGIKKFCAFIEEYYTTDKINILFQKVNYHNSNNVPGGICDMTLLYLFYLENKDHIKNLLIVDNDHAFDDNINVSENYYKDEYEFNLTKKVKNIKFINKKPYCNNLILNKDINFKVLHFQNGAKNIINNYYDADGILEIIQIKILYSLKILLKNILIKIKSLIKSVLNILIMFYRRIFNKN